NDGLDPNVRGGERSNTGLILAVQENAMKSFDVLLNTKGVNLNAEAGNGDTALMVAAYKNNVEAVKALLEKGAAVNKIGWTALHYAATAGNNDIVKILLKAGADVNAPSANKTTPLMMAARNGKNVTMALLEKAGANATVKNDVGMNAMDFFKKFKAPGKAEDMHAH
ncbi:MAG: ankyrin repeat domain-containing protein, partial [Glaciimonas sp.]|nr:ankyrin repeat domain-containing protein [Glaciimonas sp.]